MRPGAETGDTGASIPGGAAGRRPDFIGLGAQRTGTSWMYACLYEHPQLCMPRKEVNFFSRERNWSRGYGWYEAGFAECPPERLAGEYSSTYLTDPGTAARIHARYPDAKLIASLRNPVDRAHSSYLNDVVAGEVPHEMTFAEAARRRDYLGESRYSAQLARYLDHFPREQLLLLVFEHTNLDPQEAVSTVYDFLEVDPHFRPAMLSRPVGTGRVPRSQTVERALLGASKAVRERPRLRPVWWTVKRLGVGDRLRVWNTSGHTEENELDPAERAALLAGFEDEVTAIEELLGVELPEWRR